MQISHPESSPKYYEQAGNLRVGSRDVRTLLTGREGAPNNYKLGYGVGEGENEWGTPRHHHNFEQFRHPIKGDYVIGKDEVLPAGWVGYFPESAYYGPQTMSPNLEMFTMQFGGPTGFGFWSVRQRRKGFDELSAKGKFEGGVYSWADPDGKRHNQDAAEAMWEHINGRKIEYPLGRYRNLILMNPAAFAWEKEADASGVARKILGDFTERRIRVGFIRLDKGAMLNFGTEKAPEALVVKEGSVSHDGKTYARLSAFGVEGDESPITLKANEACELYYMKMPTF